MSLRDDFEKEMRDRYGASNFSRCQDGYISDVPHGILERTYASQQMLWEAYQAATERAVRIAEEEIAAKPKYFRAIEAIDRILKRLKDES